MVKTIKTLIKDCESIFQKHHDFHRQLRLFLIIIFGIVVGVSCNEIQAFI